MLQKGQIKPLTKTLRECASRTTLSFQWMTSTKLSEWVGVGLGRHSIKTMSWALQLLVAANVRVPLGTEIISNRYKSLLLNFINKPCMSLRHNLPSAGNIAVTIRYRLLYTSDIPNVGLQTFAIQNRNMSAFSLPIPFRHRICHRIF